MNEEKMRLEARARNAARRADMRVRNSRKRTDIPNLMNHGGLMLVDAEQGYVIAGEYFDLSAEEVLAICANRMRA